MIDHAPRTGAPRTFAPRTLAPPRPRLLLALALVAVAVAAAPLSAQQPAPAAPAVPAAGTSADGTTPLHRAVLADDADRVRTLLAGGADARAATRLGVTPLQLAAVNGNAAIARLLIDAGAVADAVLPEGETVLMTAARTGRADLLALLLDRGADINAREQWYGETALIWAAAENHAEAVALLVRRGADPNLRSSRLDVPRRRTGQSVLPLGDWTPLMFAARQNALAAAAALIDGGASLDLTDPDGATALVIAIINANYDAAALLLERGANPNVVDTEAAMGPLYAAIDMHRLAIGHGRPNPRPAGGRDAVDIVKLLLAKGADPNARLKAPLFQRHHTGGDATLGAGATPFMRAAKSGDVTMMRLLLAAGADPALTLANQTNALMLAAGLGWRNGSPLAPSYDQGPESEAIAAIDLCLELGLDVNAATTTGETPLHAAVTGRGAEAIVRHLVARGASLDARNKQGRTPLDLAVASRNDRTAIAAFLRQRTAGSQ